MKSHIPAGKTNRRSAGEASRRSSAGENAAAIAPPQYGIDFVDRGMPAAAPGNVVQRVPIGAYASSTPKKDGTQWDTDTTVQHNLKNKKTVPRHVIAVMRNPEDGGSPSVDPPGWGYLKTKFGRLKGQWVRFHVINALLGGPGYDETNLVPTTHALNHNTGWRRIEDEAKESASMNGDWTYLEVLLTYDDDYPSGIPRRIDAEWGLWTVSGWVQQRSAGPLIQDNPEDDESGDYLPASQITQGTLRDWGLSAPQAKAAKTLIDGTWDEQNDLESAWAGEDTNHPVDDNLIAGNWYDVLGRMYVDEDDDIDGPYPVVVRTKTGK